MPNNITGRNDRWRRLADATTFALEIHAQQTRKGTDIPYISHLYGVASLVLEHGGSEDAAIAALLHDAVEDQGAHQLEIIRGRFGADVADVVVGCTDADTIPKPPWRDRKEAYIRHLEHATPDTLLVSCADKLHNARAICTDIRTVGLAVFDRFKGGRQGTLWYYATLSNSFQKLMGGVIASELRDTVADMHRLAEASMEGN